MVEHIEREAALDIVNGWREQLIPTYGKNDEYVKCLETVAEHLESLHAADVVPTGLYKQILWERDTAVAQLAEIGKGLGEKMDDVRPVKRGKWTEENRRPRSSQFICSVCHKKSLRSAADQRQDVEQALPL